MRKFRFSRSGISPARAAAGAFLLALAIHALLLVSLRQAPESASPVRQRTSAGTVLLNAGALTPQRQQSLRHWLDNHDPARFAAAGADGDLAGLLEPHQLQRPPEPVTGKFAPPQAPSPRTFAPLALTAERPGVLMEPLPQRPPEENGEVLVQNGSGKRLHLPVHAGGSGGSGHPSLFRVVKKSDTTRITVADSSGSAELDKLGMTQLLADVDKFEDGELVVIHWPRKAGGGE